MIKAKTKADFILCYFEDYVNEENEICIGNQVEVTVFGKVLSDNLATGKGYICYFAELKESGVVDSDLIDLDFDSVELEVL